jgi:hypothetical protein
MTLEDYRIQVTEKLNACQDAGRARTLLDEVDLVLVQSGISRHAKHVFWETLSNDLDVLAQDSTLLMGKQAAVALSVVLATARAEIAQYRLMIASDEGSSGP